MGRVKAPFPATWTMADLVHHLGGISPNRIRMNPLPGKATEHHLLAVLDHENRCCELVDGTLVEKVMGLKESCVAELLGRRLGSFAEDEYDLGFLAGGDGPVRLFAGLVRLPDLSFFSWNRVPSRKYPTDPIADLAPNLAVEVLSEGNTDQEMERKLTEYFLAGVELVWIVDPDKRWVDVYTAPDECTRLTEDQTLDGGSVLPGFKLPLKELFAKLERSPAAARGRRKKK